MSELEYQVTGRYFATIAAGIEEEGAKELTELGAREVKPAFRGVHFQADPATLYRINYTSRLFSRILAPLLPFTAKDGDDVYDAARSIPWESMFSLEHTFAVIANVHGSTIRNSAYGALLVKDAIVDRFRDRTGRRPSVDKERPDVRIDLHIDGRDATVSLDTSGDSLHRRGYRRHSVEAPIQETLAAAILRFAGWDGTGRLVDPLCGSGTFLAEALMVAAQVPSGYLRGAREVPDFGLPFLPDFDPELWWDVRDRCDDEIHLPAELRIAGSDRDRQAVRAARENLKSLPYGDSVQIEQQSFQDLSPIEGALIVCNPPFGIRLRKNEDLSGFYRELGDFFKQRCAGSVAYVYFGERKWLKSIGLRPSWRLPLTLGGLDGRLARFELY